MTRAGKAKRSVKLLRRKTTGIRRPAGGTVATGERKSDGSRGIFASLKPNAANFAPLTPVSFLPRSAEIHPDRVAVIHGTRRYSHRQFYGRVRQLASALAQAGICAGDTVSVMLPNVPAMAEAHYGVPMLGAVLNTINTRLEPATIAYILEHGEAKALITDREYAAQVGPALAKLKKPPLVIDVDDALYSGPGERLGKIEYEDFIAKGDTNHVLSVPSVKIASMAILYTYSSHLP